MNRFISIAILSYALLPPAMAVERTVSQETRDTAASSYIVVFNQSVAKTDVARISNEMVKAHSGTVRHTFKHTIRGFSAILSAKAAEKLAANPNISYVEKNGIALATVIPEQVKTNAKPVPDEPPQITPYGITRSGGPLDGTGKHAWIIDTGIDLDHPDLNVGSGANFTGRKPSANDKNGHGTHVAGTIAAIDNAIDVVGIAANAVVHPVKVLDDRGSGTIDSVIAGIDYVAAQATPGDVANMSLGAKGHFQSLHDAVVRAADLGIYFAIAAGNNSDDANLYEPAHVEHANVFTISAVETQDIFASFSNYMNPPVDFAAHGVGVVSTKVGGGVITYSGTSMATPHVAGLLLFGLPNKDGYAISDPDGRPDPIAHY